MSVAIVGAGPAGLTAATELAKVGLNPVVMEKEDQIGVPVRCAEGLIDLHGFYTKDPPGSRVKIDEIRIRVKRTHIFSTGNLNIWMVDKDVWLDDMARGVESLGGEIQRGTHTELSKVRKDFDFVLDCSGCPSQSFKEYNLDYGTLGIAVQYKLRADFEEMLGKLYFHFPEGEVGFRWLFPKSCHEANVGVGWAHNPPWGKWRLLESFASQELGDYEIEGRTTGCVPLKIPSRLLLENVLLCGDAAGLANPYHAGGIHNALLSGRIAAQCLIEGSPQLYERRLLAAAEGELKVARFARSLLEESFHFHDKVISYLEGNIALDRIFTDETYRRLTPYVRIWKLRSFLLGRVLLQPFNRRRAGRVAG